MLKVQNKQKNNENQPQNLNTSQNPVLTNISQSIPTISDKTAQKTDFLYLENTNLIKNYGPLLYQYSTELEKEVVIKKLSEKHKIDEKIRTKMVDWMIEVLSAYKADTQTLFLSVILMDMYIKKSQQVLDNSHVHLLGVTCMYMMSKYEDVIPIRISSVYHKISHKAFSE